VLPDSPAPPEAASLNVVERISIMPKSFHHKAIALLRATALTSFCIWGATAVNAAAQTTFDATKPRMVANAVHVGSVPDTQKVTIAIYLKLRNTADLGKRAEFPT
jgi:hypothetical protein